MSAQSDLIKLYSDRILQLAADIPHTDRLPAPDATVKKRSPLCGSTVTVDLMMDGGRVAAFGQDVKACALGQAAAAVTAAGAIGCDVGTLVRGRDQLNAMLKTSGPVPDAPFDGFEVLLPAREYKNRHASIMLAMEAAVEAAQTAQAHRAETL